MSIAEKLKALIAKANEKTKKEDDNVADAVQRLADGYGVCVDPVLKCEYNEKTQIIEYSLAGEWEEIPAYCFYNNCYLALTSLPDNLASIGKYAFYNCSKLALTELPSGITSIGEYAFSGCTKMTSLTFKSKPISIAANAFNICPNLTSIKVPWAEGEVAGAPWGATNTTITYNYTE